MNVPDTPPVSQVYVEISSLPTQISSSNDVEDVHICGSCKCNFSDLDLFVEHKRAGCPAPAQKALSTTMAPPRSQSSLGFVTTNASNANDNSIPHSFGTQYLQLILNGENLNIENQSHDQQLQNTVRNTSNTEHQILRARLLGIAEEDASVENHNFSNNTELHSLVVGEQQQSNAKQREFQIDEEDVAALLANQLANEVVNSVNNTTIDSKTGLIHISEEFVPKSQNHFHLEALDLHEDTQDTVLKSQTEKCHTKERGVSKNNNSFPGTSGNVRRNYGNKNISNKNNVPVSTCSSTTGIINTSSICSTVTTIAPTSTATSVNSNDPSQVLLSENSDVIDIPKGRKKHMCIQCDFASWYMKDLIRHARKHTGERPFQCDWCHRSFSRLDKLQMHERIHTGEKRYTCRVCDYATHDSGSLRKHMRIHNDERPYKCQICPYRSRDSSQLTVHLRTHTGDNPFTCTFENCTSAFKTGSDLKRHSRIHTGEKPFSCSYCPYKCAIKSNLRVHIRLIHSEAKSIPCNSCSYVASTKREVKEHEKSHAASLKVPMKKKPPEIAKKKQKGTNKDSTHETSKLHTSRSGNSKTSTHLKPFCVKSHKCTYCDAAFVREDSWRSHIRQHKKSLRGQSSTTSPPLGAEAATKEVQTAGRTTAQRESMQRLTEQRENAQRKTAQSETAETVVLEAVGSETETLTSLEVHVPSRNKRVGEPQKADVIPRDYLILNSTEGTLKAGKYILPDSTDGSANSPVAANSEIETSFVQYSVVDKNDKEPVPIVHQLNQEVLGGDNLQNQPILVYVQNPPVLHNNLDNDLCNAEIVASINQSAPIFVTGRCGQFLSVPLDQGGSLVEQFTSPLQQGMQYIVSAPFDGVIGGNTTYIQPLDSIDNSGNALSVVSFQVDKNSVASTRERSS